MSSSTDVIALLRGTGCFENEFSVEGGTHKNIFRVASSGPKSVLTNGENCSNRDGFSCDWFSKFGEFGVTVW
jgi:hypothetical protein